MQVKMGKGSKDSLEIGVNIVNYSDAFLYLKQSKNQSLKSLY